MASITLQVGSNYATGATVSAYPEANWGAGTLPPSGSPQGSATTTATVAADGTVTFTGLAENTNYFAYVSGGTPPYLRFRVADAGGSSQNATTVQPASGALFSVDSAAADGFLAGDGTKNVTTAGTRVALAASTACKWVVVSARPGNTGKIVVGTVTCVAAAGSERGTILAAGQTAAFPASNLSGVYIDATVSGEGVAFSYGV